MSDQYRTEARRDEDQKRREEDKRLAKEAYKEAAQEWLDRVYMQVGKWTVHGLLASVVAAAGYFVFWSQGWHK